MPRLLMSADNPNGWTLEDFLSTLRSEIDAKTAKLVDDPCPTAQLIVNNNREIVSLLAKAEALQLLSLRELGKIGPDQGPLGTPRLGPGSPGGPPAIHIDKITR